MSDPEQFEFIFSENSSKPDGVAAWRAEWARRAEDLCKRLGVPLNRHVEVRLFRGPVLRGKLCLAEGQLRSDTDRDRLVLQIDQPTFRLGETDSILRLDVP